MSVYVNEHLNPSKGIFYDVQREDYIEPKLIEEIVSILDIIVDACYRSFEISNNNDFQIHFRQIPSF